MAGDADFDRELLARVRGGDDAAFGELFSRHADAVRRFALRHVREHAEADDLTAESFFRVLQAIRRGTGPTDHVRTYLLTVARRVAWEWSGRRRDVPVEDEELSRRVEPFPDVTASRPEQALISRAFTSLPERWRTVLWQVEVEGERPAAVAPHFGLSPNAMAALARRAREGLRAAYLQAHLAEDAGPRACSSVVAKLGTYTAGGVQGGEQRRIRKHLRTCSSCNSLHAELAEVCSTLRAHAAHVAVPVAATALAAPALLGPALSGSALSGPALSGSALSGSALSGSALVGPELVGPAVLGKAAWLGGRVKLVLAATASAAAVGLFGVLAGAFSGEPGPALIQAGPDAPPGGDVLALSPTDVTATGTATSVPSPTPSPARPVHRVDPTTRVVARQTGAVVPPSSTTAPTQVPPPPAEPTRTGEYRVFQEPPESPARTTATTVTPTVIATTTAETPRTVLVTTTTPSRPAVTPTTVTLHPTPAAMEPA
ncbi:sigma-70 family RNA polymerase sigma factor [Saccharothrix australiensis]|uniref:RNA polymerase sigma factor (Sigma-70 family) n=1 Tax=Saccharothrix australiensis TaxID=2072 RepID=A0A495VT96_9PSEU|nr:sigma-70 family RNA polymerase sigma factor [Saccharothrix australiensis]RKT51917.1 RNA polymerase sigma factor (sigma-70 family) [Saccharothrix australiensis]